MRLRFIGGPWDGLEFDAMYYPEAIAFRDMLIDFKQTADPMVEIMRSDKREHHQYIFHDRTLRDGVTLKVGENLPHEPEKGEDPLDLVDDNLIVMVYRYAPGEKTWWE